MIIKRDFYLDKLIESKNNRLIKVITGIRRVGKSFLLNELFYNYLLENGVKAEQITKIALDNVSNIKYRNPIFLVEYINSKINDDLENYIFIDEIQFVEQIKNPYVENNYIGFYEVLNEFLNKNNVDVYVTGSNSRMLSKDVLTEFRGRADQIHIMPLSIHELKLSLDKSFESLYQEYQIYGGLPYIFSIDEAVKKETYLKKLFKETYLIDVVDRNKIRNVHELDKLTNILASGIGSFTNANKIENTFKSELKMTYDKTTISNHISHLEDAFVISEAKRFDIKGRKYIGANSKYYYTDIGVRNAILNFRQYEPAHIMENIIYNQLIMLGFSVDVGIVAINEKINDRYTKKTLEVDFVINKGNLKYYIQSAYQMETQEKSMHEKKSLLNIDDSFKKIIIIKDNIKAHYDENGLLLMSLEEFLMDLNALSKY